MLKTGLFPNRNGSLPQKLTATETHGRAHHIRRKRGRRFQFRHAIQRPCSRQKFKPRTPREKNIGDIYFIAEISRKIMIIRRVSKLRLTKKGNVRKISPLLCETTLTLELDMTV